MAQASFDAWVKYYRQDENTPNATVSYYTKGALVALCLDLALRKEGQTLDAVMRGLWKRCKAGPMREQDLLDELQAYTGRSWQAEIQAWVHSTTDLPLRELLTAQGVVLDAETSTMAQRLGLRVSEAGGSVQIKGVLRGSAAETAGLAAGDEWLGLEVGQRTRRQLAPAQTRRPARPAGARTETDGAGLTRQTPAAPAPESASTGQRLETVGANRPHPRLALGLITSFANPPRVWPCPGCARRRLRP